MVPSGREWITDRWSLLVPDGPHIFQNLFEKRRQLEETEFAEQRLQRERKFKEKIDQLREQDADEYNSSRIALEKNIQELEGHLEKMMATYQ